MSDILLFFIFLIVIAIAIVGTYFIIYKAIFPLLDHASRKISIWLLGKIDKNHKRILVLSEVIYIVVTLIFIYIIAYTYINGDISKRTSQSTVFISMLLYCSIIILFSTFVLELRKKIGNEYKGGILKNIKIDTDKYLFNRISLLIGKTGMSFLFCILLAFILLVGLVTFHNIPYQAYFVILMTVPIGLAGWVYLISFDKTSQSLRRILAYIILLLITFAKSFKDFQILIDIGKKNPLNDYFFYIVLTVFIAIDRLAKSFIDDYNDHKKEVNKNNKEKCEKLTV